SIGEWPLAAYPPMLRVPGTGPSVAQALALYRGGLHRRLCCLLARRVRVAPERRQQQAGECQHRLENRKGRPVGVEAVERPAGDRGPDAVGERKGSEHDTVDAAIGSKAEIAADKERHQIDLGADADAAQRRPDKWRGPAQTACQ